MENEQAKGRSWNGYACPGCRNVFRVAADFVGDEVMCPSCQETLRLPKKPADAPPPPAPIEPVEPPESIEPTAPAPAVQTEENPTREDAHDAHEPAWRTLVTSPAGRKKLSLALGIPLLLIAVVLMLRPADETPETRTSPAVPPADEIPVDAPGPAAPLPETDASQVADLIPDVLENEPPAVPAGVNPAFVTEVRNEPVTTPSVAQVPAPTDPEHGLVDAIPATPPEAQPPEPPVATPPVAPPAVPVAQPPAENAEETPSPPAIRHHSVVRGDTLSRIARKYDVDPKAIMRANGMKNDIVRLGAKLVIPPADP